MRRFGLLIILLALLIAGGGLTLILNLTGGNLLPVLTTTAEPDASRTVMEPWKAEQLFLMIGFIVFNLIGIGATLALIFWFLDRGVRRSKAEVDRR